MEGVKLLHDNIVESSNVSWNISVEYSNVLRNILAMSYESFFMDYLCSSPPLTPLS